MKVTAIVPAAGRGERLAKKGLLRKPFLIVKGKPILVHTLAALANSGLIDDIVVLVHRSDIAKWRSIFKRFRLKKIQKITPGGRTRFESVRKGLSFVKGDSDIVLIHDGVRPIINKEIISASIRAAERFGAAVACVPVTSTVKIIGKRSAIKSTPRRKTLYVAQTPQAFKKDIIITAYKRPVKDISSITDDSMLVERLGYRVKIVPGSYKNIKVTTPEDLLLVETLLRTQKSKVKTQNYNSKLKTQNF